jgi:hypothetical protein
MDERNHYMDTLQIQAQCYDKYFEVMPEEVENAELIVEDAFSQILIALFGEGSVEEVTICFSAHTVLDLQHCSIRLRANCSYDNFTLFPPTLENIKLMVEKYLSALLRELFGSVSIDNVILSPSSHSYKSNRVLSWGI